MNCPLVNLTMWLDHCWTVRDGDEGVLDGGRLVESSSWGGFGDGRLLVGGDIGRGAGWRGAGGGAPSAVVVVRSETGRLDCGLQPATPRIVQSPRCLVRPHRLLVERGGARGVVQ